MSHQAYEVTRQADDILPPRKGQVLVFNVDANARSYNLQAVLLAGFKDNSVNNQPQFMYVTLEADAGDVYFVFANDNTPTLDPATAIALGGAVVLSNTYCFRIPQNQERHVRINRNVDKFLHIRTSVGAAVLRFYASSVPNAGSINP